MTSAVASVDAVASSAEASASRSRYGLWTPEFRSNVLVAVGWAALVKRHVSTVNVWKSSDPELYMWYKRLYSGSDQGQIRALLHPISRH